MENLKRDFIINIVLSNTQSAAFQRANVYRKDIGEHDKEAFIRSFKNKLRKLENIYRKEITETQHVKLIKDFAEELSSSFPSVLNNGKMKFGVAQKAVNLYLKFLWCLGFIKSQPIHCPVDRIVLHKVGIQENWTELDSVESYNKMIQAIREKASISNQSIAEWELNLWNSQA